MLDVSIMKSWEPPTSFQKLTAIDAHTAGEPFRVITSGIPDLQGKTILEYRNDMKIHHDDLRRALMLEPRGHADMYGCILTEPERSDSDFGILFLHNEGFSTMCGHGIIGIATVVVETGMIRETPPETVIRIDSPAGLIIAKAKSDQGKVTSVAFQNVPSFVLSMNASVHVDGIGDVAYDIAFGGAFYAFVDAEKIGIDLVPENCSELIRLGMKIKRKIMATREIKHPFEKDLGFLYGTIFTAPPKSDDAFSRNVCIFAEGEVDRSPTGTGVSARLAIHHAKGDITENQNIVIESIIGTRFSGKVLATTEFGPHRAVIPQVEGTAWITGKNEFLINPDDPLKYGFFLR